MTSANRPHWRLAVLGAALILLSVPISARGDDAAPKTTADSTRVAELIQQLGADDFAAREKAQADLAQIGLEAFDALHAAQNHNDPEIALRARYLVRSLGVNWFQESDSPDVVKHLKGYGELGDTERRNCMDRLAALPGGQGVTALCRLSRFETVDTLSKYAALKVLGQPEIPDPAARTKMAESIAAIVGNSNRPAANWLRLYGKTLADPAAALADWDTATKAEHATLDHHPQHTSKDIVRDLYRWQVELLKRLGRDPEAVAVIRRTFSLIEENAPDQLIEIIDWLLLRQAYDVVLEISNRPQFAEAFGKNPLLLYRLAETQSKLGQADAAKATAERALAINAESLDEHFRVAYLLQERGLHAWAEREYRDVMKTTPAGSVLDFRSRFYLSEMLHDQGRDPDAADILKPLCELMDKDEMAKETCVRALRDPEGVYSRMNFFAALSARDKANVAEAEKLLDKAVENDPTDADALIALYRLPNQSEVRKRKINSLIEEATKKFRAQMEEFRDAAAQAPTEQFQAQANQQVAQECNQLAWLVGNTFGDIVEALRCSHRSLELRPDYAGYLDTLGRCYYAKGDLENAVKYQSQAVKLDPHSGQIRRQLEFFEKERAARGPAKAPPGAANTAPGAVGNAVPGAAGDKPAEKPVPQP